jgi:hypothetical protein
MELRQWALVAIFLAIGAFVWHCPIFKPWFGFWPPKGQKWRWWE